MLKTYKELKVWQKSFALCADIYRISTRFPSDERFGLTSQLRRAAVSIPSNIAEGYARDTTRDYIRFLWVANGSLAEVETQLMLTRTLRVAPETDVDTLLESVSEIERMLRALIRSLGGGATRPSSNNKPEGVAP